jgi:hypothetical protein
VIATVLTVITNQDFTTGKRFRNTGCWIGRRALKDALGLLSSAHFGAVLLLNHNLGLKPQAESSSPFGTAIPESSMGRTNRPLHHEPIG